MSVAPPRSPSLRRNAVSVILGRGASALMWVAVTPFALARLGPERFGVWSLFFVFGGYAATLDLGMASVIMRFVAVAAARGDRRAVRSVLLRSLAVSVGAGLIWCLCILVLRDVFLKLFHVPASIAPEVERSLLLFACSILVFSGTQVLQGVLIGFQRFDLSNLYFFAGLVLHAILLVWGLGRGFGLMAAAAAMVSGNLLSGTLAALTVSKALEATPESESSEPPTWRELLSFGGTVQATGIVSVGQLQAGKVLLGALGTLVWVTQFELGFRVANALSSLPILVQGSVIPAAARASAGGGVAELREVYGWACRWVFSLAGALMAGLWLVAPALFTLWLGPGQAPSVSVARALAVSFAFATLVGPATAVARGAGWPGLETAMFAAALGVNLAASLWCVPRFGPVGAAAAMALGFALSGAGLIVVLARRLGVSLGSWLARTAAPRFLPPAGIAAAMYALGAGRGVETRTAALPALVLQGGLFLLLVLGVTWPVGDSRVVWGLARSWMMRVGGAARGAGGAR